MFGSKKSKINKLALRDCIGAEGGIVASVRKTKKALRRSRLRPQVMQQLRKDCIALGRRFGLSETEAWRIAKGMVQAFRG